MFPKSFSASALRVAALCPSRYVAEIYNKSEKISNDAAGLGTVVHNTLEQFVTLVFMRKEKAYELDFLLRLFEIQYMMKFRTLDRRSDTFFDGVKMLTDWFERDDIRSQNRTVLSVETKTSFPIKIKGYPVIPFNYIWDRFDRMDTEEEEYTVVDYKTNRWQLTHDDLKQDIQAKSYGLAAQIAYPNAKRIWVEFDFLRHKGGPVGVVFTRQDNIDTWKSFKPVFQEIWDTDESAAEERLNKECVWCIRKTECATLASNTSGGGTYGLSIEEKIDRRARIDVQVNGLKAALSELDDQIMEWSKETEQYELETDLTSFKIGLTSPRRSVDPDRAKAILGPDLWDKYGRSSLSVGDAEALIKGIELTDEQKQKLAVCIYKPTGGTPKIQTKLKTP